VRSISEEWVGDKGLPEMGFTLGGVEQAMDPAVRVGLAVDDDGSVHGFTSWLPVYAAGGVVRGWTLDVTRRRSGAFRPVSEFLIASACLAFQAQGAEFVSLSGAPLARAGTTERPPAVERLLDALGAVMEPHYGFRSLHAFKSKFSPRYEPMYLAYRDEGDLPRIGIALTKAYLPDANMRDLVKLATSRPPVPAGH
jgi:phosphatidylglycerol lysyltransferase